MFIDSDFNANSFGNFDTDATQDASNYMNAAAQTSPLVGIVDKYSIHPTKQEFQAEGACSGGFIGNITCGIPFKNLGNYDTNSGVKTVYDNLARTKNSYGYGLQEMLNNLASASVQAAVSSNVPFDSNMTCSDYVNAGSQLDSLLSSWNSASVTNAYDRDLRAEYLSAIASAKNQVASFMDARDCNGATSAIDSAQDAAQAANQAEEVAKQDAEKAASDAASSIKAAKRKSDKAIEELKAQAISDRQVAEEERAALDKRNKMIMFGAGLVILVLIIKK